MNSIFSSMIALYDGTALFLCVSVPVIVFHCLYLAHAKCSCDFWWSNNRYRLLNEYIIWNIWKEVFDYTLSCWQKRFSAHMNTVFKKFNWIQIDNLFDLKALEACVLLEGLFVKPIEQVSNQMQIIWAIYGVAIDMSRVVSYILCLCAHQDHVFLSCCIQLVCYVLRLFI